MKKNGDANAISCSTPGNDAWYSQKCFSIDIKFQQEITFNFLPFILASALHYLGDRHISFGLTRLDGDLKSLS